MNEKLSIIERVQGWDSIIEISKVDPASMEPRPGETPDELAQRHLKLIALVYNEGTIMDAKNKSQRKYFPWAWIVEDKSRPSGFGLSYDVCGDWTRVRVSAFAFAIKTQFWRGMLSKNLRRNFVIY